MPSFPHCLKYSLVTCLGLFSTSLLAAELFVSDRATNRILSFDETTGEFLRVVTETGLDVPSGLAFGPGGFLYATNLQSGFPGSAASVVRIDPVSGTTMPFITDVVAPGGIAYHAASDTLFISEFGNFDGDEVFRYSSTGMRLQTLGSGSAATGRAGMILDMAGNLYVSESNFSGVGSVLKYNAPPGNPQDDYSTTATTFASGATVTLQFPAPPGGFNGLTFDSNGDLFVASLVGQSVIKYTVTAGVVTGGASFGPPLAYPSSLVEGLDGNLIVTNLGNDNVSDPFWGPNLFPGEIARFTNTSSTPHLIGDANRDDLVDAADLAVIQTSYGADQLGDLDGDLDTDGNDFLLWQRAVGNQGVSGPFQPTAIVRYIPPGNTVQIPEAESIWLIAVLSSVLAIWRPL